MASSFAPSAVRDACLGLARMVRAGVPLREALGILAGSTRSGLRKALRGLERSLAAGDTVSRALSRYPALFHPRHLAAMAAAERAGDLAQGFDGIGSSLEAQLLFRQKLFRGLRYPAFLVLSSILLEPLPHALLQQGSYLHEVRGPLFRLALLCVVLLVAVPRALRIARVDAALRRVLFALPGPGALYVAHVRAVFCRVLSRNLVAGLALPESLRLTAAVAGDPVAQKGADHMITGLAAGRDLGTMLGEERLCDPADLLVVVSGERSGALPEALSTVAERYRERLLAGLSGLLSTLNVLLTVALLAYSGLALLRTYHHMTGEVDQMLKGLQQGSPLDGLKDMKELKELQDLF